MRITAIAHYLPQHVLDNRRLVEAFGFDQAFIETKLGIRARRRCGQDEGAHALAHAAATRLIEETGIPRESIEFLVVVTQNPDYKLPNVASLAQHSLGLPTSVCGLDISLGCSGFVHALAVAKGLMAVQGFGRGLILTADPYSKVMSPSDRATAPLFGDAGAAVLVEASAEEGVLGFTFGTDGSGAEALIVRTGGSRHPAPAGDPARDCLTMDGRAIFNFMMQVVPRTVAECLEKTGVAAEAVDYYVMHQASAYMLKSLASRMGIPETKLIVSLDECGNTVSSSIPLALEGVLRQESGSGKLAVLCGFGVGLSWGTSLIRL